LFPVSPRYAVDYGPRISADFDTGEVSCHQFAALQTAAYWRERAGPLVHARMPPASDILSTYTLLKS
jgi:hypothetical protein